MDIILITRGI